MSDLAPTLIEFCTISSIDKELVEQGILESELDQTQ